ncbi:MAG TPA: type II toxin-antitoxin system RelE/ParE family toxin [Chloroflexota bacterium]|nr:type II toxin-antitoxin system RelE/ParE family toxin [Chloroflexota bacterium]
MVVSFLRQALRNLEEIHAYYATRPNPAHAHEVLTDIRAQIERLAQYPAYGRSGKKVNTRELIIRRYPYIAVYRVVGERVVIIRVHHARRHD